MVHSAAPQERREQQRVEAAEQHARCTCRQERRCTLPHVPPFRYTAAAAAQLREAGPGAVGTPALDHVWSFPPRHARTNRRKMNDVSATIVATSARKRGRAATAGVGTPSNAKAAWMRSSHSFSRRSKPRQTCQMMKRRGSRMRSACAKNAASLAILAANGAACLPIPATEAERRIGIPVRNVPAHLLPVTAVGGCCRVISIAAVFEAGGWYC